MSKQYKSELPDLASQLQGLYERKNWRLLWQMFTIDRNWGEIAGREVANQSRPAYIRNRVLWIYVGSSVWMHHLQSIKPQLIDRVRHALPEFNIDDIRWIMQPAEEKRPVGTRDNPPENLPDPEQTRAFEGMASIVENRECRAALCHLWRLYQKLR